MITDETRIFDNAFRDCGMMESVTSPPSVTSIGAGAFGNCSGLTDIAIPSSVTSVGAGAFRGCGGLTTLAAPSCVIADLPAAFPDVYTKIANVNIGDDVTSIGDGAFRNCNGLKSVTIPSSVTNIGSWAFGECSGLSSVTIPSSVTSFGNFAFCRCTGLRSVTFDEGLTTIGEEMFSYCTGLKTIAIPSGVTSVGAGAFRACCGLTSVSISEGVTSIGSGAFSGCSGLTRVDISDLMKWYEIVFGNDFANPLYYAKRLYLNGDEVKGDLMIPASVPKIRDYAFCGCIGLTSVTIPGETTGIGVEAFYGCNELSSVTVLKGTESIGAKAFADCFRIREVTIPSSVVIVGENAFSGCGGLGVVHVEAGDEGRVGRLFRASGFDTEGLLFIEDVVECQMYMVEFNANGGSGIMEPQTFVCGEEQALRLNGFTRSGYRFVGWAKTYGGSVAYSDQQSVKDLSTINGATVVLYAVWESDGGGGGGQVDPPAPSLPMYGPWGEAEAVKNPDKLGPTMLTDMTLELNGAAGAVGGVVAAFRGDTGALCGLGKVLDESGTLSMVCYAPTGVRLHFKV